MTLYCIFSTGGAVQYIKRFPRLGNVFDVSYSLVLPMCLLATTVPAIRGQKSWAEKFILSTTIATILTIAIFAFLPAIGPWTVF